MAEEQKEKDPKEANQEIVDHYRDLIQTPAWSRFRDHLERHLKQREVVKAEAIRNLVKDENFGFSVALNQGWIDGVNFVIGEPNRIITRLSNQAGD